MKISSRTWKAWRNTAMDALNLVQWCISVCLACLLFYILRESIFLEKNSKMELQKEILTHCSAKLCCLEKPCLGVAGH
ncbi:hypothetical protein EK904_012513 [Melospiza melodia maxima]|nr:hypothetical protein EK904_012513 [Melospiza melodia maxima]